MTAGVGSWPRTERGRRRRLSVRGPLHAASLVFAAGLAGATVAGFGGRWWWALDILAHFRVQYLALSAAGALALWLARERRAAAVLGACAAANALVLLPYLVPSAASDGDRAGVGADAVKVLSVNVLTPNRDFTAVRRLVQRERPDVVLLMEVDEPWLAGLADLRREYPHGAAAPREDNFGIALLSRHPCPRCRVVTLGAAGLPSVAGEVHVRGRRLTVVGTHPVPPAGARNSRLRDEQLRAVGGHLAGVRGPKVLMGDLNATPWSASFAPLLRRAGVRDTGRGWRTGRTWPTASALLGIPIDHVLASPGLRVVERRRGPHVGSDHFPLLVTLRPR